MSNLTPELQNKKKALGRGLGSLLGGAIEANEAPTTEKKAVNATQAQSVSTTSAVTSTNPEGKVWQVGIDKINPGAYQPRKTFEKEALQELSNSIKQNGILQPIIVRKNKNEKLEIIAGERRWRAAQMAGLHDVPVIIKTFNDKEALELAIIENIQREDLNPIEEAEGFARLISEFSLSQQEAADRVGKERATVANAVRLLSLPSEVKDMIAKQEITAGHAKALLSLVDPKKQIEFAKKIVIEKTSVRALEKLVAAESAEKNQKPNNNKIADDNMMGRLVQNLSEEMQKLLGTKVNIDYADSKGKISIYFYSNEELNNLIEKLKIGCQK